MKAKKAVKRLSKVESLLTNVIHQFSATKEGLGELLDSAKSAVARARESVTAQLSANVVKKQSVTRKAAVAKKSSATTKTVPVAAKELPATAQPPRRKPLSAAGRKKISLAAKKRWALAKRKGVNAVTGRPLAKTA